MSLIRRLSERNMSQERREDSEHERKKKWLLKQQVFAELYAQETPKDVLPATLANHHSNEGCLRPLERHEGCVLFRER